MARIIGEHCQSGSGHLYMWVCEFVDLGGSLEIVVSVHLDKRRKVELRSCVAYDRKTASAGAAAAAAEHVKTLIEQTDFLALAGRR